VGSLELASVIILWPVERAIRQAGKVNKVFALFFHQPTFCIFASSGSHFFFMVFFFCVFLAFSGFRFRVPMGYINWKSRSLWLASKWSWSWLWNLLDWRPRAPTTTVFASCLTPCRPLVLLSMLNPLRTYRSTKCSRRSAINCGHGCLKVDRSLDWRRKSACPICGSPPPLCLAAFHLEK